MNLGFYNIVINLTSEYMLFFTARSKILDYMLFFVDLELLVYKMIC